MSRIMRNWSNTRSEIRSWLRNGRIRWRQAVKGYNLRSQLGGNDKLKTATARTPKTASMSILR